VVLGGALLVGDVAAVVTVGPPVLLDNSVPLPPRLLEVDPGEDDGEALLQFVTITPGLMQPVLDVIVHVPSV